MKVQYRIDIEIDDNQTTEESVRAEIEQLLADHGNGVWFDPEVYIHEGRQDIE